MQETTNKLCNEKEVFMIVRKHKKGSTEKAKELRKSMTSQEIKLWDGFLKNYPIRILRQKVINYYILDFYCRQANLAIDIDGNQHYTKDGLEYDKERDYLIEAYGIKTIRIKNKEVDEDFKNVCKKIDAEIIKQIAKN